MSENKVLPKPVDWDQLYPGRFLKAGEFMGRKVTLTIADVELDELEGNTGKKVKGIISFRETTRQLALNRTNGICLKAMFGRKLAEWAGKRVTLFPGNWNGEECIRVWGSPDIAKDEEIVIDLPRKKPQKMVMHKVVKGGVAEKPAIDREPPIEREPGLDEE